MSDGKNSVPKVLVYGLVGFIVVAIGLTIFTGTRFFELRRQAQDYRQSLSKVRERAGELADELKSAKRDLERLSTELVFSREQVDKLQKDLEGAFSELRKARDYIEQLDATYTEAGKAGENLRAFLGGIKEQVRRIREGLKEEQS